MIWGFDLGGTKVEGVVMDEKYNVLARKRVPTGADKGYENVLNQVKLLVDQLSEEVRNKPTKIGMGTPGSIDPVTRLLKNCNSQTINGKPFKDDLEKHLNLEITMVNDANCFALAEAKMGSVVEQYPSAETVFGVIMGTGVGGGIVFDSKLLNGHKGNAGEWGHSFIDEAGGKCYCGNIGCVETILSGPRLEDYYESLTGKRKSLRDINDSYLDKSDPNAIKTIERLIKYFGKSMANIVNILDPDVIVLGGGVSNLEVLYTEGVKEIEKYAFNPTFDTPVIKPKLGDSAGVFGASLLYS